MKTQAKLYITSHHGISQKEIYYLAGSNFCLITNILPLSNRNFIVDVEFKDYKNLLNLIRCKESYHGHGLNIKRVFKSMKLRKRWLNEVKQSFLIEVISGIEGLIKHQVDVKVTGDGAWSKALTQRWQKALDNQEKFREQGINPLVDITKTGELRFHIVRSFDYIITFFEQNIDELVN
jgi:hypothetical protein